MRLHDLFEADLNVGMQNLNKIAQAVKHSQPVEIQLGTEPVTLEYPEARFVYGLYKHAVKNGTQQDFMTALSDPKRFDNIMQMQRDIMYRDRSGEEAAATARRLSQESVLEAKSYKKVKEGRSEYDPVTGRTVHRGSYGSEYQGDEGDDDDFDQWGNLKPQAKQARSDAKAAKAADSQKKGRGRPTANIKKTSSGIEIHSYNSWYNKTKRTHPERRVVGSAEKAVAVVAKDGKNYVVGQWTGHSGTVSDKMGKTIADDKLKSDYKSAKGRPKKVREWIETLKFAANGR